MKRRLLLLFSVLVGHNRVLETGVKPQISFRERREEGGRGRRRLLLLLFFSVVVQLTSHLASGGQEAFDT